MFKHSHTTHVFEAEILNSQVSEILVWFDKNNAAPDDFHWELERSRWVYIGVPGYIEDESRVLAKIEIMDDNLAMRFKLAWVM